MHDDHHESADNDAERQRLTAIAVRVLGGATSEADDAVQEAFVRLSRTEGVEDPPAWLTTVMTRGCLDRLRKVRARQTAEQAATDMSAVVAPQTVDPASDVVLADQVGAAMGMVIDALVPAERAAFVLHDVFGYPFADISAILGRSEMAVRQLASRARRKLRGGPETADEIAVREDSRQVADAFLTAARTGDVAALMTFLAPEVVMRADPDGQRLGADASYEGVEAVAARFTGAGGAEYVTIDDTPGAAWIVNAAPKVAFLMHIEHGHIHEIELIANPEVLRTMEITVGTPELG